MSCIGVHIINRTLLQVYEEKTIAWIIWEVPLGPVTINLVKYKPVLILKASLVMRDSCLRLHLLCYFGDFNHLHLCIFSELLLYWASIWPLWWSLVWWFISVFPSLFTFSLSFLFSLSHSCPPTHIYSTHKYNFFLEKSLSFPIGPCYLPNFCCYMDCSFL